MHQVNWIFARTPMRARRQPFDILAEILRCTAACVSLACLASCGSRDSASHLPQQDDTALGTKIADRLLNRGLSGEPQTLDPQLADDTYSFQVIRDLYEGLTAEDSHGKIAPGVAATWTTDRAGRIYQFTLRPNAKWSDGRNIVAADFVRGLQRAVDPKTGSSSAALLAVIKNASEIISGQKKATELGATAINESLVQIELEHPAPYILEILSQPIAAPLEERAIQSSGQPATSSVATNGPYVLVNRVPGSLIEIKKNHFYWNLENVAIDRVRYINSDSEATALREYAAGQLDLTFTVPAPDVKRISLQYPTELQEASILGTFYLALNLSKAPLKANRDLRQALSMAVDRDMIAEHVNVGVTPAYSFVARGIPEYTAPKYQWSDWNYERRLAYARDLYSRAGYSQANPLHLKLYFNRDEGIQRLMMAIAGSWKQNLGVDSELESDEFRVFLAGRKDKKRWDVARLGWSADYADPVSFLDVFYGVGNENDPGYASTTFDDFLRNAEFEPSFSRRNSLLTQAEQILLDDYPIIPVYFYTARRLVKPYVGGAEITPMNRTYSKHLFWKSGH